MIVSFGNKATAAIWTGMRSKQVPFAINNVARRKLRMLNAATEIEDLRIPPGNRLASLGGKFKGYYSIRINLQWRIIFNWENGCAYNVQIIDYH